MKRFAIVQNNIIVDAIIAENAEIAASIFPNNEIVEIDIERPIGIGYERIDGKWKRPKPADSWIFNDEVFDWEAPIPYPEDGKDYVWNEEGLSWMELRQ